MLMIISAFVIFAVSSGAARTITIENNCHFGMHIGVFTGVTANGLPGGDAASGGWRLASKAHSDIPVPDNWTAGRFWGRTECDFSKPDVTSCATGSCIGGEHCTQPGIPPATLAEFTLVPGGQDNYDVSNVDGSNLPMAITAPGCPTAACPHDLNPKCPDPLRLKDHSGTVVGCRSACNAIGGESNCCTGAHNTPGTCPSSGVQFYDLFKKTCPRAYAYAYDEGSHTALWTCSASTPKYTVKFCP